MSQKCSGCGAEIPEGSKLGACPKCLMSIGLEAGGQASGGQEPAEGVRIGRYKLLEKIGEGGYGVVYMAEQEQPVHRRVALKVIKPGMDTHEVIARFEAERQALALMDHQHIAKVFDGGATESGRPYFVMELVRGLRITEYCDQKKLSTRERLDLFMQVCQAVQHAHQKGIIHRDLKPSNILVTVNDGVAVPKVIDFGVAKATGQRLTDKTLFTKFHQLLGTPAYMSPEQAEMTSVDIDTRSDIYSLGVLLYELLTGRTPFDTRELLRAGMEAMMRTIREQDPVRPSARLSTLTAIERTTVAQQRRTEAPKLIHLIRGDLDWIVMKCLEKDRARRYETANGLATDIQRHLGNLPVSAGPPGNLYRFQKTVRRHKLVFAAAGAILTSLLIGLGVATIMFMRELAERRNGDLVRAQVVQQNTELERRNVEFRTLLVEAARSDRVVAEEKLQLGLEHAAFAYLARACRYDPSSVLAAEMAVGALGGWNRDLPITILEGHTNELYSAQFNPTGTRIVTASVDGTARLWDVTTGQMLVTLTGHTGRVSSAEFNLDGTRILTGSYDNTARVWDSTTGQTLTTFVGHEGALVHAHFSPDGTRIVTASPADKSARVWDARSGNALVTLAGYTNMCITAQFSPDGTRIVTAGDGTAHVWDAVTGKVLATLAGHKRSLRSASFSPDGARIVTASWDKTARVWDAWSGDALLTLVGHEGSMWCIENAQFSPDGTRIVTAGRDDKTVRIWEAVTGKLLKTLTGHEGEANNAQFSPDGERIVSVSFSKSDTTARVWHTSTGKPLATLSGHQGGVWSAQFSPDGKYIVTASNDGTARIWDTATLQATLAKPKPYGSVEFSSDRTRVVTALRQTNTAPRVWDIATGKTQATLTGHTGVVSIAQFSPDGTRIVTAAEGDHTVRIWEAVTGRLLKTLTDHVGEVWSAQFNLDGARLITKSHRGPARLLDITTGETLTNQNQGYRVGKPVAYVWNDETARVWDVATGEQLATFAGNPGKVWRAQFSPDGSRVVTTSGGTVAGLWDIGTGKALATLAGHTGMVSWALFSPDGKRVATASMDKTVRVWDSVTGKALATLVGHTNEVRNAQFSLDGTRIITEDIFIAVLDVATGKTLATLATHPEPEELRSMRLGPSGTRTRTEYGTSVRLWDASTGEMLATLGDRGFVRNVQFSPDGRRIITTLGGAVAYLWDSVTGKALGKLAGHTGPLTSAQFSPDGTRIVTTSYDKTARLWDAATGTPLATVGGREEFRSAQLNSNGTRIVTTANDWAVQVWDLLPKGVSPPPEWFPDFLRYMAQMRLNSDGRLETLKPVEWLALRERLRAVLRSSAGVDTPYIRILRRWVPE